MAIIPPPPNDVRDCVVFRQLRNKSTTKDGLAERVDRLVQIATPLLDLVIAGPFQKYTLHNPGHAKKLVHLAGHLVNMSVLDSLSALECSVIVASSYIHDLAMALTSTERDRIVRMPEFEDHMREWPELWGRLEEVRMRSKSAQGHELLLLESEAFQLQEVALTADIPQSRPLFAAFAWRSSVKFVIRPLY